jgi:hypothetical protein
MVPLGFDVLDKKMHHEVVSMFLHVKILQEEARLAVVKICELVRRPCEIETQILIETLGEGKVPGWDEGLDFNCGHVLHCHVLPNPRITIVGWSWQLHEAIFGFSVGVLPLAPTDMKLLGVDQEDPCSVQFRVASE